MSYPPAKCPCSDCSLTAPIRGWFAMNPPVPSRPQGPAPAAATAAAAYSRQLENHQLPAHLKDYDVASPRVNSVLALETGSIVDAIYLYTKFTAACIFHEWAACEEELVLLQKPGLAVVGGQQHLELALMGRNNTDWAAVWQSIWMPPCAGPGLPAERAKVLAYNSQLHASNAGVELMLRGFPRLDAFSPHRVQVLAHRTYNRQGYSLRIHHRRVPAAWRGLNPNVTGPAMASFYDTAEISPIPVQEGLIRLMLPIPGVHLWGDHDEKKFLGPIRLAHELILNDWASEARLLHMSRHEFPPKPGQEIRLQRPPLASISVDGNSAAVDAEQHLDVAVELRELARYFCVIRAIQEVLVLNELVMQCTKPAGSSAASVQRVRLQEQMDLRDLRIAKAAVSMYRGEGLGPASRRSIDEQRKARVILAQKHSNDIAAARKLTPYQPGGLRTSYNTSPYQLHDQTLCTDPQWISSVASVASPSGLSFLTQTAEQRAHRVRTLQGPVVSLEGDFQKMHAQMLPPPRRPAGAGHGHQQQGFTFSLGSYHQQPLSGAAAGQHTPRQLQCQTQMEQRQLPLQPEAPQFHPDGSFPPPPHQLPRPNQTPNLFSHIFNPEAHSYNIASLPQAPTRTTTRNSQLPIVTRTQSQPSVLLPPSITAHTPTRASATPTAITTTLPLPPLSELGSWTTSAQRMKRASVESMVSVGSSDGSGSASGSQASGETALDMGR